MKNKNLCAAIILILAIILLSLLAILYSYINKPVVTDFESCVKAGFPVMESYPRQCRAYGQTFTEIINATGNMTEIPESVQAYFVTRIWEKGVENNGGAMPVEGFDPNLYKGAFPGLKDSDFSDTEAIGGIWKLQNGALSFVRDSSGEITSADGTLTEEGVKTLLKNIVKRLGIQVKTNQDADNLLNLLSREEKNFCSAESRKAEACITIYQPVCGYFNSSIQCIKAPCAGTYSNSCVACMDGKVDYWISGECKV